MVKDGLEFHEALKKKVEAYGYAFKDARTVAKKIAEWISSQTGIAPAKAYWIYVDQGTIARDKGVSVEIYELKRWKLPLILAGLVGIKTAGIEIKTPVLQCEEGRYFVGVGAVTDYDEPFKNNSIVLSISASF